MLDGFRLILDTAAAATATDARHRYGMCRGDPGRSRADALDWGAEVGVWLAAMDEARCRTLKELEDLTPQELESRPAGAENTIATILYHLALIEADWLVSEILQWGDATATLGELLPFDARDLEGRLTQIDAMSLREHVDRLAAVRALLHTHLDEMRADDFHRLRSHPDYDVSPAWVLQHLSLVTAPRQPGCSSQHRRPRPCHPRPILSSQSDQPEVRFPSVGATASSGNSSQDHGEPQAAHGQDAGTDAPLGPGEA
jgi:uncharacterized damage-inducible protein DinB